MSIASHCPRILLLSSSLLTERMILHSSFLPAISEKAELHLWTTSSTNIDVPMDGIRIEPFPAILPFREFPYNYLRRLNEYVWDFRLKPPSRLSMMRNVRDQQHRKRILALKGPARALAVLRQEARTELWLEQLLLGCDRSPEGRLRLSALQPDLLVTTGTFRYEEPAIVAAARRLNIPVLAAITSWDNPSTKNRMVFGHDGYLVWSEQMKRDMHHFFPRSRGGPIYLTGAPQFDVFFQDRYQQERQSFCREQGLDPDRPIVLYAMGSPNLFREVAAIRYLGERVARGELGEVQLLVRPHPIHDDGQELQPLRELGPRVRVQTTRQSGLHVARRSQDERQIREWINTFRHAAVVVNLSSTSAIDGAIFDKPVVNLDFDPEPGQPRQQLVKDLNHQWTHFKPIAESGGMWMVENPAEMVEAVRGYLAHPEWHREKRRTIIEMVCGRVDGRSGERMAEAILDFTKRMVRR